MLLCINANAAVDKTVIVENFSLNAIHRPSYEMILAGGKSCNLARAAKTLGLSAAVAGWVGGHAGNYIETALHNEGIQTAFIHTAPESRTCYSIVDPLRHTLTEIYERGYPVSAEDMEAFLRLYQEWLPRVEMVALCGSLASGLPPRLFADLALRARAAGVRAVLDTSGEALHLGVEEGHPYMLKCNRHELAELVGQPLKRLEDVQQAARSLARSMDMQVIITLGKAGALAEAGGQSWRIHAPHIKAVSTVGSGDAFLAGLACGMLSGKSFTDSLRLAAAAGSANALQLGAGRLDLADVERLREQVIIRER
jgi:tagatose 6-phosphate kinase